MLIKQFKTNQPFLYGLLLILAIIFWVDSFIYHDQVVIVADQMAPLFVPFYELLAGYKFWSVFLSFIFMLVQAFMLNSVLTDKNLVDRNSFLPALVFITLMSSDFKLVGIQPFWFSGFFLIIAINKMFDEFDVGDVPIQVFNVGFLISVASLFYYPALVFYALLLISLSIYYQFNIKTFIASLVGLKLPYMFVATWFFWTDQLPLKITEWVSFYGSVFNNEYSFTAFQWITFSVLGLLALVALTMIYGIGLRDKPVRIRKRNRVVLFFFLLSVLITIFYFNFYYVNRGIIYLPFAAVLSVFFQENRRTFWNEFFFSAILILLIVGKLLRL